MSSASELTTSPVPEADAKVGAADETAGLETLQLKIGGTSCSFCAASIEKALGREKGVVEIHFSLAHEEALVRYRAEETGPTAIKDTFRALGFTIRDPRKRRG